MNRKYFTPQIGRCLVILGLIFFACLVSARAQQIGVRPFLDCVEREDINDSKNLNYIAYFGYSNPNSAPSVFPPGGPNNFFFPEEILPQNQITVFAQGVHPRVVSVKLPIGEEVTWVLGIGFASASFNGTNLCSADGANSRLITYQGKLWDGAQAANGTYDLQFQLFNQQTGGTARTGLITLDNVQVTGGVFTVQIDLGANALTDGNSAAGNLKLNPAILDAENSFFEIGVRAGTSTGAYTTLTPRQPLTAVPLAMRANTANNAFRAVNAANATNATYASNATNANNAAQLGGIAANQYVQTNDARLSDTRTPTAGSGNYIQNTTTQQANSSFNISGSGTIGGNLIVGGTISGTVSNATNAAQLGGVAANQYVQTNDARLSDTRTPTAGSGNYIQNTTTQQVNSNFNIGGSGTAGGTLSGNVVNAATQFNIGGNRVLSNVGASNLFVGVSAGAANTTGIGNVFSGSNAGLNNTTGNGNAFFGTNTGFNTTTGSGNAFFGTNTGLNTTTGSGNAFFGSSAGSSNTVGTGNTAVGDNANFGAGDLTNATAIGSGAIVRTSNTIALGRENGSDSVRVFGNQTIGGTTDRLLNVQGSSAIGTWLTLNNTTTGGRQWSIISTGASNGEGAGKLLFYDLTNNTGRMLLSDTGANITGNLTVSGAISGATKNFKIDHPLDPLNKTLTYTSVESPDMMNIYNGNAVTDDNGEAIVTMPAYFEALNKDFRYQLTVIGQFAQAIVAEEISGNTFTIKTDKPNVKVSWQVTGIRHDRFAEDKQITVEQEKSAADKGKCLYAPACGNKEMG